MRHHGYWYLIIFPWLLVLLGTASNQLVLASNHDTFPVLVNDAKIAKIKQAQAAEQAVMGGSDIPDPDRAWRIPDSRVDLTKPEMDQAGDFLDDTHVIMLKSHNFKFLADWIDLRTEIASPGDLGILLGSWMWMYSPLIWLTLMVRRVVTVG